MGKAQKQRLERRLNRQLLPRDDQPGDREENLLEAIHLARAKGKDIVIWGTIKAQPLVEAAGLPWLHQLPQGAPMPRSYAMDGFMALATGVMPPMPSELRDTLLVLGAGTEEFIQPLIAAAGQ